MFREFVICSASASLLVTLAGALTGGRTRAPAVVVALFSGGVAGALLTGDAAASGGAAVAVAIAPVAATVIGYRGCWHAWARIVLATVTQAAVVYLGYSVLLAVTTSHDPPGAVLGFLLIVAQVGALTLTLSYAWEVLDVLGRRRHPARDAVAQVPDPTNWPAVCVQVPAYNEPPALLIDTIARLTTLDYPGRWMIQVVDNNTVDEATWRPVEDYCRSLGERVHFMHLANWPGYKSGALNEATRRLPEWVEVVAIVDADYLVEPDFLRATARHFADPAVAFVQTPQHYREWTGDRYLSALFFSYKYFFDVAMVSRHEHNAIIFGGTMGLIRRTALEEIGGWDEWCITEDAEASLRLLGRGYRGVYDPRPFGAGLMPLSLDGLKKQRFRWAFGGIQILRRHWRALLGLRSPSPLRLTGAQRAAYLLGGLQWFNETLTVLFTALLLTASSIALVGGRLGMPSLTGAALAIPPLLLGAGVVRTHWALRVASGCTVRQATRAYVVFFALSWVVARACIAGLVRRAGTFLRTPKVRDNRAWQRAIHASAAETAIAVACACVGCGLIVRRPDASAVVLASLLVVQAVIYLSAPLCGLWAEGVRLTPAMRLFARSAQSTGERPMGGRPLVRNGLAAGLGAATAVLSVVLIASPPGVEPFSAGAVPRGPALGRLFPGGSDPGSGGAPAPTRAAGEPATPNANAGGGGGASPGAASTTATAAGFSTGAGLRPGSGATPVPGGVTTGTGGGTLPPTSTSATSTTTTSAHGTSPPAATSPPTPSSHPTPTPAGGRPTAAPTPHA